MRMMFICSSAFQTSYIIQKLENFPNFIWKRSNKFIIHSKSLTYFYLIEKSALLSICVIYYCHYDILICVFVRYDVWGMKIRIDFDTSEILDKLTRWMKIFITHNFFWFRKSVIIIFSEYCIPKHSWNRKTCWIANFMIFQNFLINSCVTKT